MTQTLTGRTALVTGSTSGIGAATAHRLAAEGARVVVTGRDVARGDAVAKEIRDNGGDALFVASDLTAAPDVLREFAKEATDAAGSPIDLLVHNAAVCPAVDTLALSDADLEQTLAVNIRAPHVLTAALAPAMTKQGQGVIIVVGSWMAEVGHPFVGLYSASKAAEAQLARSWAAEFGPRGVRVNIVAPGATRTPINDGSDDVIRRMTENLPAGRAGLPADIAAAIAWLASDQAAYVHGATIAVDGGITTTRAA
ncbi:SDR family NAD(P)-dependent oxidoreductase [Lentzea pudingi]|nr:SDR family oxidoreductase [Lentzea pudingi]